MKISLNWLREFVDLHESTEELRSTLDDLGLVVEGIHFMGVGLEDVVVARVEEIRAIEGADRVRLVVVDAGNGPLEIVCGATNFAVGNYVPMAPVGAVLPGGFTIAERRMRGVTSNGMLCSSSELELSDDHEGLMLLDELIEPHVGEALLSALKIEPDVIFDISVEGNRPDAWSVEGVARDLATRLRRPLRSPAIATTNSTTASDSYASAGIDDPDLCGRLTVSVLRNVKVLPSPSWVAHRLQGAGMRPISNVVDASNLVMLELGQPTHPYDAQHVAGRTLRARRARPGETLTTLDGVERKLAKSGKGLGDTGEDCVIVDGDDHVLGLAGVMGGASSEISRDTTDVLVEAAFFDPMSIARSSKRHGLRSEASNRFERGVDPHLALRAVARFVAILSESVPALEWLASPLDVWGTIPTPPTIALRAFDVERLLGMAIPNVEVTSILEGLGFTVSGTSEQSLVTAPSNRLDIRDGVPGRADVIEEIARLYSYRRLPRHSPAWPELGGLNDRQLLRRHLRDVVVDAGGVEAWTPTLGSDADFDLLHPHQPRVRVTNPLAADESVLRATQLTGLVRAWARNYERGVGDVMLAEFGVVFVHPDATSEPRETRGGTGGELMLALPKENERLTIVLGRPNDDATTAVALWSVIAQRLGLAEVVVRSSSEAPRGLHPTRAGSLVDRSSGALLGYVGEVDGEFVDALTSAPLSRRLGLLDLDLDVLADSTLAVRSSPFAQVPSRYPSAVLDLALVTPRSINAHDLAHALRVASGLVESVVLFDVYEGAGLSEGTRSLAFNVRLSSVDRTLSEQEISEARGALLDAASSLGAVLR
ncbi:MAG TPA: phenylalanine--tRNA ligase subunit beta [Acidimicrobiales bacterium]|nr:phenylalanine--tRNA ligase subunit beta [Acidimicrobiales bacterium]